MQAEKKIQMKKEPKEKKEKFLQQRKKKHAHESLHLAIKNKILFDFPFFTS